AGEQFAMRLERANGRIPGLAAGEIDADVHALLAADAPCLAREIVRAVVDGAVGAELLEPSAFRVGTGAGDDAAAMSFHHLHRCGTDAAAGAEHKHEIVGLHVAVGEQHAESGAVIRRDACRLDEGEPRVERNDEVVRHAAIFRHAALHFLSHHAFVGERVHQTAVAHLPSRDIGANRRDFARDIAARYPGHRDRQARHAATHENVEIIEPARLDPDQQIAGTYLRIGKIAVDDVFYPALLLDHSCFHARLSIHTLPRAVRMTSGVIGWVVTRAANGRNASFTAFMTTAGAAPVPDSPTPLAPSSDADVGVCTCATSLSGISPAMGVR